MRFYNLFYSSNRIWIRHQNHSQDQRWHHHHQPQHRPHITIPTMIFPIYRMFRPIYRMFHQHRLMLKIPMMKSILMIYQDDLKSSKRRNNTQILCASTHCLIYGWNLLKFEIFLFFRFVSFHQVLLMRLENGFKKK